MNDRKYTSDGMEVSVKDFLTYLLSKIIVLIILLIVGVLIFFGFHGIQYDSSSEATIKYLLLPAQSNSEDPSIEAKYYADVIEAMKSDDMISRLSKDTGIDASLIDDGGYLTYEYVFDSHSFKITVNTKDLATTNKLATAVKIEFNKYVNTEPYFKSISLLHEKTAANTHRVINKKLALISVMPLLIAFLFYCFRFLHLNPLLSKKNFKRILPEVDCYEYNDEANFANDLIRIDSKLDKTDFINIEVVDCDHSSEIIKKVEEVLKNELDSVSIFEIDHDASDHIEFKANNLANKVLKVNYDSFNTYVHSDAFKNMKEKNQIITIEAVNGNDSLGYRVSCLTKNTLLVLGTKEKKNRIINLIDENVYNKEYLRTIILFPNFFKKKGGKHK